MTKKTDENLTPTFDESADTKIYEKNVDTGILNAAQQAIENKLWEDFQVSQAADTTDLPTISWGNIGDYRIIRKIGEGGMGIVYEAEQQHPRRLVALKVIRTGFHADDYHIKLFEREIQALARLKHPGIADIYESGRSDDGQIFFAMELVRGTPFLEFVRRRKFSDNNLTFDVVQQLELFRKICEVVSYAHLRGVIHRDLKPDNILVTDESEEQSGSGSITSKLGVKILDFGLARITDPEVVGTDQLSRAGQIKGTLQYMSPEQVRGKPEEIDVRSDVYSLGVMLYEMLTDQLPYDISQASIPEAVRIIIEQQPKMPSIVWNETHGEGRKKSGKIDKDVETIVIKALEKDPERRYQSVAGMSDDIERYLTNKPILARPPSTFYQFRKLVARHKAAFSSLAIIFLMLVGFAVVMAAQSARLVRERDRALKAEQISEQQKQIAEEQRQIAEEQKIEAESSRQSEQKQRLIAEENLKRAEEQQSIAEKEKASAEKAQKAEQEQRLVAEQNLKRAQEEQKRAEEQTVLAEKQQAIAHEQKTLAEKRQIETEEQRLKAEEQKKLAVQREKANRQLLYVSQINLAERAWEQADIELMEDLLESQIPPPGQEDLRGFEWYYLWNLANLDLWTVQQQPSHIKFSPVGKILAVNNFGEAGNDLKIDKIKILDESTGQEIDSIEGRLFLAFSSDGKLITISEINENTKSYTIEQLDVKTKQISILTKVSSQFLPAFSPDGKLMASISKDGTPEIWDLVKGNRIFSLNKTEEFEPPPLPQLKLGLVYSTFSRILTFSPDGKILAIPSKNGLTLWDVATGKQLGIFKIREDTFIEKTPIISIVFSPDSKTIAILTSRSTVRLWDISTQKTIAVLESRDRLTVGGALPYLDFSPDGKKLAMTIGNAVKLWDISTNQELATIKGHHGGVTSLSFSPDSKRLITTSWDGTAKLWRIPTSEDSLAFKGQRSAAFSPDSKILATVGEDGRLRLWDFATNQELSVFGEEQTDAKTQNYILKFSPDGKMLAVVRDRYGKGTLELWDLATKKNLAALENNVVEYAFSPNSKMLATVIFKDGKLLAHLWDVDTLKMLSSFKDAGHVAFTPDGKLLALGYDDEVKLIDISTGEELIPPIKTKPQMDMAFSPDGKILAAAFETNLILWDFANQKEIGILKGHRSFINFMTFSPDSKRVVTGDPGEIKIWDLATQQELTNFKIETDSVMFSPDGLTLIAPVFGGIQVWRRATEEEVLKRRN